jgi:SAM-dependent methyltransferase
MHESSYNEMKSFVARYLDRCKELSILEIGSLDINGSYKPLFANSKWKYTGLDVVEGKNVDIVSTDKYHYPIEDEAFDVVISGSTIEHVQDMHAFMREIKRVMKKDGIICIVVPWTYPEHKYPQDCWRVLPDGMKFLIEEIAGIKILNIHKNETDCVGIAGIDHTLKASFGVLINDLMRLDMVFRQSEIDPAISCHTIKLPESATKGLNKLLEIMETEGNGIAILSHQDMFYRSGWIDQVKEKISELPDSWIVAGIIGKDMEGKICGRLHDMRIPLLFSTSHNYPEPASCFDECCIIVNLKKGFRFDENIPGFDLYGTLAVLQAKEIGGTAWIIDAFAEHYCMRPFTWYPDKSFENCFKWLYQRFPNADRIDTTVLGLPEEKENKAA